MRVSAPGKLVLLGDYAVLDGGRALVAAVDRRAVGVVGPGDVDSRVVTAILEEARSLGVRVPGGVRVDTSGFVDSEGRKLGIGSSAAVAVVTAALASGRGDETCLALALEGHRKAAGGVGSGIDVACSYHGGVLATGRQPGADIEPLARTIPGLELSVLFTGQSASTAELVSACRASPQWNRWMDVMRPLSEEGIDAWRAGRTRSFLSVVARYGRAMAGLGRDAGVPVVTPEIETIMRLAEQRGGSAKPSGAGGGDVVVVVSEEPGVGASVARASGAPLVPLHIDPRGLVRS